MKRFENLCSFQHIISDATVKVGLRPVPVMGISLEGATNVGVLSWYLLISVVSEAATRIMRKFMKALFQYSTLQSLWAGGNCSKPDPSRSFFAFVIETQFVPTIERFCMFPPSSPTFTCWKVAVPVCTAQGGGGSFKNRKPIGGWLLWMMDRRANELMDRQAVGGSAVELLL